MAEQKPTALKPHQRPFFVRGIRDDYDDENRHPDNCRGALKGYDVEVMAQTDCDERNARAKSWGLKARYEVVAN